ncbi:MAG TPA: MFS transporter [Gaiellaceae bacterium]
MAFAVLFALAALDSAGYSIIAPVVPEIGDATGAGPGLMGVLVASFAVGQMVGYPLAARVLQRRHAVAVLFASLALVILGDLGFIFGETLGVYFPARLVQGIGAGGLWIGTSFAILERYPGEEYKRLTGILAAYGIGSIAGPAIGGLGGIQAPFAAHLVLVTALTLALVGIGAPKRVGAFGSDRGALRTPGFWLASAGILMVALTLGTFDGPMPLHFGEQLSQAEIAALYVFSALVSSGSAAFAGRQAPRPMLAVGTVLMTLSIAIAGATEVVGLWVVVSILLGVSLGTGEAGSLGVLLESIGVDRIVLAMVVWSQVWAVGYLVGPAIGGGVAEALGYGALGLVPLAASAFVFVGFSRLRSAPAASV